MLVADRSPTVRRSVSPRKGRGSSQCSGDLSVTDQRWGDDRSALYRRSVAKWSPSVRQSFGDRLQTSPTCLRMAASFRNKCSKSSDRLFKMLRKSSRKKDLLAIQSLNQYCLRLLLINRLYTIMATIAPFWFTLSCAATATVQLLEVWKLAKKWSDYKRSPFYMFLFSLRIYRQLATDESPLSCNLSPIIHRLVADRSQQIASLSPYSRLIVADRSPINRWQSAKPIAD